MSVSDASSSARRHVVAVGPTREDAATPFGLDHSYMFLTSYDDLSAEVDLDDVDSMDLAAGAGLYPALDLVCPRLGRDTGFSLRIEYAVGTGEALTEVLERNGAAIKEVQTRAGSLLLVLECGSRTSDSRTRTILAAVDAAATASLAAEQIPAGHPQTGVASPAETTAMAPPAESPAARTAATGAPRPKRPRPRLLSHLDTVNRWRGSRRRRTALLAAVVALALVLLVVGLVSGSPAPVVVMLLAALVVTVLASTGLLFVTTLTLARQVHAQTGRIERIVRRNRTVLEGRATAIERQLSEISKQQKRLPFMQDYLEAMAAANATAAAQLNDQIQTLRTDATDSHLDTQGQSGPAPELPENG